MVARYEVALQLSVPSNYTTPVSILFILVLPMIFVPRLKEQFGGTVQREK